jgi:hypothetical protein
MGCTVGLHIWIFLFSGASSPEGDDPMLSWLQVPFSAPYRAALQLLPLHAAVWLSGWHSPPQYTPLPCLPSQRSAHPLSHIVSFIIVFFRFPNVSTFLFLMASVNCPYIPGCHVCVSTHLKPVRIFYDYDLCRKGGRDSQLCFLGTLYWCVDIFTCPILHSHVGCLPIHCSLVSMVTVATTYPHSCCLLAFWSNLFGKPIYPWSFEL